MAENKKVEVVEEKTKVIGFNVTGKPHIAEQINHICSATGMSKTEWLESCVKNASQNPIVKKAIQEKIELLKKLSLM